ncbi:hypothetical protein SGM_0533 [Streptomyces griseoaurantiacus M045]|uniref:Uncharacterized protein n=1 Tax=Streptomyces griseoaurantiacus M045 TaxID=996637 RepID=F3NAZ9_9ACTN|nr:hypothetical protein SGM_0533 [Streptomyces griseoaurantiacus M045]
MPSTKNPAIAQTSPTIPRVARSGPPPRSRLRSNRGDPQRDPIRPRERGCAREPFPKPAISTPRTCRSVRA